MTDASLVLSAIAPEASAGALESLSETSALAAAVKKRANVIMIAWRLKHADRTVRALLERAYGVLEGKVRVEPTTEALTSQQLEGLVDSLDMIARMIDSTYESMRRVGLTNNSLTAGTLRSFVENREGILDLADWVDAYLKSGEISEIFTRAQREKDLGQVVDISQV